MPTVFFFQGIRFRFFANEGNPCEPIHIHAERADAVAKIWIEPDVSIARNVGYNSRELSMLLAIVKSRRSEIEMNGMPSSAKTLRFDDDNMWLDLTDGRTLGVPLAWFPILLEATPEQRQNFRIDISGNGIHWEDLDEDISVEYLLKGFGDMTNRRRKAPQAAE